MNGTPDQSPEQRPELPSPAGQLWHALRASQPSQSSWLSALRRGLLVALIAAIGAAIGEFATAAIVAIGALNLGLVDAAVARRTLARTLVVAATLCALVAFLSSLSAGTWWTVPLLVALAYVLGTIAGLGITASTATFLTLVTAIIFTNDPGDLQGATRYAILVLVGGLLQAVSSVLAWRYERDATLRRKLALTIDALVDMAQSADGNSDFRFTATARELAAQQAISAADLSPQRQQEFDSLVTELNWTRLCLSSWVSTTQATTSARDEVSARLRAAKLNLEHAPLARYASGLSRSDSAVVLTGTTGRDLDRQLTSLTNQTEHLADIGLTGKAPPGRKRPTHGSDSPGDSSGRDRKKSRGSTRHRPDIGERPTPRGGDYQLNLGERFRVLAAVVSPQSSTFRQGVRLAIAIGVAQSLALVLNLERGYWLPLTVVMVVRPDFSTTLIRGSLRVVGTIAAVVLVGTLLDVTGNPEWLMVSLLVVFAPLVMRWISANYVFGSFAISSTVLILIEAGEPAADTIELRLINTLLGVIVAIGAYLLVPSWSSERLVPALIKMLDSQRDWTRATLASLTGNLGANRGANLGGTTAGNSNEDPLATQRRSTELRSLGQKSRDAILAAAPLIDQAALEPHRAQCDAQSAFTLLTDCHRSAIATFTLEIAARRSFELSESPALATTVASITANLDAASSQLHAFNASIESTDRSTSDPTQSDPVASVGDSFPVGADAERVDQGLSAQGDVATARAIQALASSSQALRLAVEHLNSSH